MDDYDFYETHNSVCSILDHLECSTKRALP